MKDFFKSGWCIFLLIIAAFFVALTLGQLFGGEWLAKFADWLPNWGTEATASAAAALITG